MSRKRNRNTNHPAVPQDHRPAQDKPRTVTVKGVALTIDPRSLDDWELMESLYDLQSDPQNNALSVVPFLRGMFSAKDYVCATPKPDASPETPWASSCRNCSRV